MKLVQITLFLLFSFYYSAFSQIKPEKTSGLFYKISLASTLKVNEDYVFFDKEDNEILLVPSAFFINNTVGYQFDKRSALGLNIEYDYHSKQGLHFIPAYLSFRYNIFTDDNNTFIRGAYGTLLGIGKSFEKGNLYKLGIGTQFLDHKFSNSALIGLDFTQKRFGDKSLERLSSVSFFIEFIVF